MTDEEVDKRLDELSDQYFDGDDEAYQALEKTGQTEEQVLATLHTRLLAEKIFKEVTSEVEVTDEDIQAYYEENKAQFEQPASRRSGTSSSRRRRRPTRSIGSSRTAPTSRGSRASSPPTSPWSSRGATSRRRRARPCRRSTGRRSSSRPGEPQPVKTQFGASTDRGDRRRRPGLHDAPRRRRGADLGDALDQKKNTRIQEWVQELQARYADQGLLRARLRASPEAETTTGATDTQPE